MTSINRLSLSLLACAVSLSLTSVATAQSSEAELREEIEALKQGQEQIRKDLAEIKRLLQARQAPAGPNVEGKTFELGDNPVKGASTAKLTLVEFTDYQ